MKERDGDGKGLRRRIFLYESFVYIMLGWNNPMPIGRSLVYHHDSEVVGKKF